MKLLQVVITSNDERIEMNEDFHAERLIIKEIQVVASGDVTEDYLHLELGFLESAVNHENNKNNRRLIIPMDTQANVRKTIWEPDLTLFNVFIPRNFNVKVFDKNGTTAFGEMGSIILTMHAE